MGSYNLHLPLYGVFWPQLGRYDQDLLYRGATSTDKSGSKQPRTRRKLGRQFPRCFYDSYLLGSFFLRCLFPLWVLQLVDRGGVYLLYARDQRTVSRGHRVFIQSVGGREYLFKDVSQRPA